MKSKSIVLIVLLSAILFSCSQEKIVELPLTMQNGYGPFGAGFTGAPPNSEDENNPWKNTYLQISKFPKGLTYIKHGNIETNIFQSVYQNYLLGNITKEWYEYLQKSWNWTPDTLSLSKNPVKTKIAFVYGIDSEGILKMVVDANNNLDLSDDKLSTPPEMNWGAVDSLAQVYAFDVSFETFVHNKIVSVSAPLLVTYNNQFNVFMRNFPQYATTKYKGKQIAVSSNDFTNLLYDDISVAFINDLKKGEKANPKNVYKKNEYIEIKEETFKILGVNINKNNKYTLVLERINTTYSTQTGYKSHPFQGEEFTTGSFISLEDFKGKYVLLDFWSMSCAPCIQEFPALKELYAKTDRAKFEIIGIIGSSSPDVIRKLIDQHAITWPQVLSDDIVKNTYGIKSYPATFIIDKEGIIISKNLRGKKLEEEILSLINE